MTKQQVITLIESTRETFEPKFKPESVKGWRYHDNEKVIRNIKIVYYTDNYERTYKFEPLPKIEDVPDKWIRENIDRILNDLCYADHHFSNKEKWGN